MKMTPIQHRTLQQQQPSSIHFMFRNICSITTTVCCSLFLCFILGTVNDMVVVVYVNGFAPPHPIHFKQFESIHQQYHHRKQQQQQQQSPTTSLMYNQTITTTEPPTINHIRKVDGQTITQKQLLEQEQQSLRKDNNNNNNNNNDNNNGRNYPYQPHYIHIEQCRYLSVLDCQKRDEMHGLAMQYQLEGRSPYQKNIEDEKQNQQEQQHQSIISLSTTGGQQQNGSRKKRSGQQQQRTLQNIPQKGTNLKVLVLLIRFKGHESRTVPTKEYYQQLFNGYDKDETLHPIGSIREYLWYTSMGQYNVTFDVQDWFQLDNTEEFYSQGQSGLIAVEDLANIFIPKLNAMDATNFDFFPYDDGGWGVLNQLAVITSGYGAELGDPQTGCTDNISTNRIWSQGAAAIEMWTSKDFFYVYSFFVSGAFDDGLCQYKPGQIGIYIHEYLHGLGAYDLYDADEDEGPILLGGTGRFDIMSNYYGWNRTKSFPGHPSPYTRNAVGWLDYIEITENGLYPIQSSEISSQVYMIQTPYPSGEYLLIENRQPIQWDTNFPTGGIVIYHVDEQMEGQTKRGYPGHPNFPKDHYRVSVIQADGKYDIENGENPGDETDFWIDGMKLGPSDANGAGTTKWPNTDSYQSGTNVRTGFTITIKSPSRFIMLFEVTGLSGTSTGTTKVGNITKTGINDIPDPSTTAFTLEWLLSMLTGIAALVGLVLIFA